MRVIRVYPSGCVTPMRREGVRLCTPEQAVRLLDRGQTVFLDARDFVPLASIWRPRMTWRRRLWLLRRRFTRAVLEWQERVGLLLTSRY